MHNPHLQEAIVEEGLDVVHDVEGVGICARVHLHCHERHVHEVPDSRPRGRRRRLERPLPRLQPEILNFELKSHRPATNRLSR